MNIKDYIQSGIIESCVLGLATEAERREFEHLCNQHAEIVAVRKSFELALEKQLLEQSVRPPAYVKAAIMHSLKIPGSNGTGIAHAQHPVPIRGMRFWKFATAACLLLIAGLAYWLYSVNNKYREIIQATVQSANRPDHASHPESVRALKTIVETPSMKWSTMVEPANEGHCMAHIYWDSLSKNTFLLLGNIPKPVADKQFQLWAMLDNQPVNLGIFDVREEGQLIRMKNINKAKNFVITIEPKGGSSIPNTKATYAVGEL